MFAVHRASRVAMSSFSAPDDTSVAVAKLMQIANNETAATTRTATTNQAEQDNQHGREPGIIKRIHTVPSLPEERLSSFGISPILRGSRTEAP
jgi:hypothetical protein